MEESRGWARGATIALYGWMAVQAFIIFAGLDYIAGNGVNVWFATAGFIILVQSAGLAATLVTAIFVLTWMYRAMATARRRTPGLPISPAGAVGWFFVPIANLWKPYEVMVQIVEGNAPNTGMRSKERDIILWWWVAWLGRGFVGLFQQFSSGTRFVGATMVIAAIGIGGALALQTIIRGVEKRQTGWVDASIFA